MFETPELTTEAGPRQGAKPQSAVLLIQFLRFLAAFAVVLFHSQQALSRDVHESLGYWFEIGAAGVHVFFCISGFVIMHTSYGYGTTGMPTRRFLLKRFVRIFPIYWICCLLYVAYHQTLGSGYTMPVSSWVGALLLLPTQSSNIIGPGWTLSYELYFYLCFAVLLWLRPLATLITLTAFFIASVLLGMLVPIPASLAIAANPLILEFVAGCWLGFLYVRFQHQSRVLGLALVVAGVALFIIGGLLDYRRLPLVVMWGAPSILIVAGSLLIERSGPLPRLLQTASRLGDSSYVLYLIHILLITIALHAGLRHLAPMAPVPGVLVAILVSLFCTVVAALIFEHLERPLLRWLRRNLVERFSSASKGGRIQRSSLPQAG
jgi:exopolysaccharide production protein ExoZ